MFSLSEHNRGARACGVDVRARTHTLPVLPKTNTLSTQFPAILAEPTRKQRISVINAARASPPLSLFPPTAAVREGCAERDEDEEREQTLLHVMPPVHMGSYNGVMNTSYESTSACTQNAVMIIAERRFRKFGNAFAMRGQLCARDSTKPLT